MTSLSEQYFEDGLFVDDKPNQPYRQWGWFELFYFFVMLVYAAQMTIDTGRMVSTLSGNPIPFFIPIVLTIILLFRNPISFASSRLWIILGITAIWSIASLIKYDAFSKGELSFHFFLYYAIIIAYIHVKVYGTDLMILYEKMMVMICKLDLVLWLFCIFVPTIANPFFEMFPATGFGHNFLYIFNQTDIFSSNYLFPRNSGFSWEPGRFAIMICFALLFNFQQRGIDFNYNRNSNLYWFILALISTESTTGYSIALVIFGIHYIQRLTISTLFLGLFLFLPSIYWIFQLDFMLGKITTQYNSLDFIDEEISRIGENSNRVVALDRMPSFIIEWGNFLEDPLLGYSRNLKHAAIYKSLPENVRFTGGLMQMFSQYGVFMGLFYYTILWRSSRLLGQLFDTNSIALFLCFILSTISYPLFMIPLFFAFWLFGEFYEDDEVVEEDDEELLNELEYEYFKI